MGPGCLPYLPVRTGSGTLQSSMWASRIEKPLFRAVAANVDEPGERLRIGSQPAQMHLLVVVEVCAKARAVYTSGTRCFSSA